ncbi:MAG: hypothetical protein ACMG57_02115 [Candidatus Dojkabacteria bacterium]
MKKIKIEYLYIVFLTVFLQVLAFGFLYSINNKVKALGTTYTVCDLGCDYTTLTDALNFPGTSYDTIQLTSGYVFNTLNESTPLNFPDGITLECQAGATPFGSAADPVIDINPSTDSTIQNCTFENVNFDATNRTNVKFLDNTFSNAAASQLVFTATDGFTITGNKGLQHIQIQNADNAVIENNSMECRFNNNCITLSTAGGGPFDYLNPADVPNNILINNNIISNFNVNTGGDYVYFGAGINVDFTANIVNSGVVVDDTYITMVTDAIAEVYAANNYIIFPTKVPGSNGGTWGFNVRVGDGDVTLLAEHNTIIMDGNTSNGLGGSACIGIYDSGTNPIPNVNLSINHNLCDNISNFKPGGTGVTLSYFPAAINLTFTDSYNGFGNIQTLVGDSNGLITSLSSTTVTLDPVLRTENASTLDDYYPVPMSRYLDVNGSEDIGAFSDARVSNYTIDDTCIVDYSTCFSHTTSILNDVLKDGDVVNVKNGTYPALNLNHLYSNITLHGEGGNTIFDAGGTGSAVSLDSFNNSTITGIQATNSFSAISSTYTITHSLFTFNSNTYDQSAGVGLPSNSMLLAQGGACNIAPINTDGYDLTSTVGAGVNNFNLILIDVFGFKITLIAPNDVISSAADTVTYLASCGAPVTVDLFLPNLYTVSGQVFTYNATAVSNAGVTLAPGLTDPPRLDRAVIITQDSGIKLVNSSNNVLDNILLNNNTVGVIFDIDSTNNSFTNSNLNSVSNDVVTFSADTNNLTNSSFDISRILVNGTGNIHILYSIRAAVFELGNGSPIQGAVVKVIDVFGNLLDTLVTGANGLSPYSGPILTTILTNGGTLNPQSGGINPITFNASAAGYNSNSVTDSVRNPFTNINILLGAILVVPANNLETAIVSAPVSFTAIDASGSVNNNPPLFDVSASPFASGSNFINFLLFLGICLLTIFVLLFIVAKKRKATQKRMIDFKRLLKKRLEKPL